jgi:hypothetical protein
MRSHGREYLQEHYVDTPSRSSLAFDCRAACSLLLRVLGRLGRYIGLDGWR